MLARAGIGRDLAGGELLILMDFIEKVFHLSPDGGNGSYETLIIILVGLLVFAGGLFSYSRVISRRRRDKKK
jgi:hypothetical protein